MKLKELLGTIVVAGAVAFSTAPSAAPVACSTVSTVALWAGAADGCYDDYDQDVIFKWVSDTLPASTGFNVIETETGGTDFYVARFIFASGWGGGGTIVYTMTVWNSSELIGAANFDTDVQGTGFLATAQIAGNPGPNLLLLTSTNGSHDPVGGGETPFSPQSTITVTDTFNSAQVYLSASNSFAVIPEPGSLALLGLGLVALFTVRRRAS